MGLDLNTIMQVVEIAAAFETGGASLALEEAEQQAMQQVAQQAFSDVSDPHDRQEVAQALHNVNYAGMCGLLNFAAGPAPGVAIIPPVGVQWKASNGTFPFEMKVVDNTLNPSAQMGADLEPTNT